ncbi:MAG: endolytic transglycosylase MltG [Calditrichota bacterium]|jgi:UPF0755 protein
MNIRLIISKIVFGLYLVFHSTLYYLRQYWKGFSLAFILIIALIIKIYFFPAYIKPNSDVSNQKTVFIPRGSSLSQIAGILEKDSLLEHKTFFVLLGKISGYQNQMQAGLFKVPEGMHPWHLLIYLTRPKLAEIKVTLPEGIQAEEMAHILAEKIGIDSTYFMDLVLDSVYAHGLGVEQSNLEGYLLPETYFFTWGMNADEIIRLLVGNTLEIFKSDSVQRQLQKLGMTRNQIITMASIIEGEVMVDSERTLVSSVYHNRLKRHWLLGADPTIQYIIPGPPRRLLDKDLEIDSPYNTYKYRGLPPGPISNPGKLSILAALYPANTRYMYFVATGDGGHHFSRTAAEHAYWKSQFDQVRREVRREQQWKR